MITEKEFLNAVEIIREYKNQIKNIFSEINEIEHVNKTPIIEWLDSQKEITQRLYSSLKSITKEEKDYYKAIYMEDITKKKFFRVRNAGIGTWKEFCKLTNREL